MRPHRRPRAHARGFTLIELMVVVVIIGVLATIAVPLFGARIRQRAVQQTAGSMAETFRSARARALGRGVAVMVSATPGGNFTVLEAVKGAAAAVGAETTECGALPTRGCTTNDWGDLGGGGVIGKARNVGGIPFNVVDYTTALAVGATAYASVNVCYSASGRAFVNTSSVWVPTSWTPLTDVVRVTLTADNHDYNVVVLPNGVARLAL